MPGNNPALLVILGGVSSQFQDLKFGTRVNPRVIKTTVSKCKYLGGEVFEDGGEIDGSAGSDALRVAALLEIPPDSSNGELEARLDGPGDRLLLGPAALPAAGALLHLCSGLHLRRIRCC